MKSSGKIGQKRGEIFTFTHMVEIFDSLFPRQILDVAEKSVENMKEEISSSNIASIDALERKECCTVE